MMLQRGFKYQVQHGIQNFNNSTARTMRKTSTYNQVPQQIIQMQPHLLPLHTLDKLVTKTIASFFATTNNNELLTMKQTVKNLIPNDSFSSLQRLPSYLVPNSHRSSSPPGRPYLLPHLDPEGDTNAMMQPYLQRPMLNNQ